jgi:DNA-binding beta-propeller fold protein YncE
MLLTAASAAQLRQIAIVEIPGPPGFGAVAFAGRYLLISHTAANTLDIFDPTRRRVIAQIKDLSGPRGIAVDEEQGKIYIANSANKTVAVVSTQTWKVEKTIALDSPPDWLLLVPQRGALLATNWHERGISSIKLETGDITSIPLNGIPQSLAYDRQQETVFVSLQGDSGIIGIGPDNKVAQHFEVKGPEPTGLAFDSQSNHLYVAVRGAVLVLDPASGAEVARVPSPESTDSLWYDPDTHSVYAAAEDGSVNMIRAEGGRYFSEDELKTQVKGHTLAFDSGRKFVYMPGGREGRSKLVILKRVEGNGVQSAEKSAGPQAALAGEN